MPTPQALLERRQKRENNQERNPATADTTLQPNWLATPTHHNDVPSTHIEVLEKSSE